MKLVAYPLAALLGFFGVMFVVGSHGRVMSILVGVILLAAAGFLIWLALHKPKESITTVIQKIELSGDVSLQDLGCRACGGTLGKESVAVKAGAVFVNCQYCGATYQIEEAPKW